MEIDLTGEIGGKAIVSKEDYKRVSKYSWNQNKRGYVRGKVEDKNVSLHRFVMNAKPEDPGVDHIDGNKLDNRKENLRFADELQNGANRLKTKNAASKYYGVTYYKNTKKYYSRFVIKGKIIYCGQYDIEKEAAVAYDMYIVHNKIEFKKLNFPEDKEKYLKMKYEPVANNKTVKYLGVYKIRDKSYEASIKFDGKRARKTYDNEIDAAKWYDKYHSRQ